MYWIFSLSYIKPCMSRTLLIHTIPYHFHSYLNQKAMLSFPILAPTQRVNLVNIMLFSAPWSSILCCKESQVVIAVASWWLNRWKKQSDELIHPKMPQLQASTIFWAKFTNSPLPSLGPFTNLRCLAKQIRRPQPSAGGARPRKSCVKHFAAFWGQ